MLFVICLALILFLYAQDTNRAKLASLRYEQAHLEALVEQERVRLEKLELELKSQSDPEYIEMMLKGKLGVAREHEQQVIFKYKEPQGSSL